MDQTKTKRHHFQRRTGSFSTHGYGNGRVEVLPPAARPEEEVYLAFREQFETLRKNLDETTTEVINLRRWLNTCHPRERADYHDKLVQAEEREQRLKVEFGKLRKLARDAGEMSFCTVFYHLAETALPKPIFANLDAATRDLLGRQRHEIPGWGGKVETKSGAWKKIPDADRHKRPRMRTIQRIIQGEIAGPVEPASGGKTLDEALRSARARKGAATRRRKHEEAKQERRALYETQRAAGRRGWETRRAREAALSPEEQALLRQRRSAAAEKGWALRRAKKAARLRK